MIGADFENMTDKIRATASFNDQSYHSSAITLATLFNSYYVG
jgi:hypothetical protein